MSDSPQAVPEELQVLAGEYVLGVLDIAEMRAVRRRAMADPGFAAAIDGWERRLAPMADALVPAPPPDALWSRIEQAIAPVPMDAEDNLPLQAGPPDVIQERPTRAPPAVAPVPHVEEPLVPRLRAATAGVPRDPRIWPWKLSTAVSLALAAGVAAFTLVPMAATRLGLRSGAPVMVAATSTPPRIAALMPPDAHGFFAAAQPNGTVLLTAMAPVPVPNGHDLELWMLSPGETVPTSLGVLPAAGKRVTLKGMPPDGTQLMVSMEPSGGSTTGAPTGPVVYAGSLGQLSL